MSSKNKLYCGSCYPQEPIPRETGDQRLCRKHFNELYPLEPRTVDKGTDVQGSSLPKATENASNVGNAGNAGDAGNAGNESNVGNEMKGKAGNADNAGNERNKDNAGNDMKGNAGNADYAGNAGNVDNAGNETNASSAGNEGWIVAGHVVDGEFEP